jgi:alkanesulfonate monooxygenase SsuD/methylene tetrahydromethanopterin reductase-like flavin-dependent oxidoreductase (luciferase family)
VPLDFFTEQCDRVRAACDEIGRTDPMVYSAALIVCAGRDEAEVARRAAAIGREPGELRQNGAAGTVDEVAATLRRWADAGAERIYLQVLDLDDLDHLDLIAHEIAPLLG